MFGWKDLSGVGISFGADRIYDVMEAEGLFGEVQTTKTRALLVNFGGKGEAKSLELAAQLRAEGGCSGSLSGCRQKDWQAVWVCG